jgi:hypothetical protein
VTIERRAKKALVRSYNFARPVPRLERPFRDPRTPFRRPSEWSAGTGVEDDAIGAGSGKMQVTPVSLECVFNFLTKKITAIN